MWLPMSCSSARVLEPLAFAVAEVVERARLIEHRERQPRHLPGVSRLPVAALGELDRRAAANVGIAIDAGDFLAVAMDVVEHETLAERQVAERDLLGPELAHQRIEENRAGHDQIGTPRIQARKRQALIEWQPVTLLRRRFRLFALTLRLRTSSGTVPRSSAVAPCPATGWCRTCR